jgi:hypothetical protein
VTAWRGTIRAQLETRSGAIRFVAFAVAATLSWSLWASCAAGAVSAPHAQMACCKDKDHACRQLGTPTECCKTAPQASQFTVVRTMTPPFQSLLVAEAFGSILTTTLQAPSHPSPLSDMCSPSGTKHPTYLRLSNLRI